jgi:hypothetical protein
MSTKTPSFYIIFKYVSSLSDISIGTRDVGAEVRLIMAAAPATVPEKN